MQINMNNKTLIGFGLAAVLVLGIIGGYAGNLLAQSNLGGDFAGGNLPSNLLTGSASGGVTGNGYIQPVGGLAYNAQNGLSVGGNDQYHGLTAYVTASGTPASVVTLGAFGSTTSSATSSIPLPETAGLSIGAICSGSSATTTVYISGCVLATTDGATGTATVAYSNLTGSSLAVPTSTLFRISFDQLPY
jgi:hypothetical protein